MRKSESRPPWTKSTPLHAFRKTGDFDADVGGEESPSDTEQKEPERAITCRACGQEVTRHRHKRQVDGAFEHTKVNPSGILFRIGCFREADGCGAAGPESTEFSWFEGYSWQVVICRGCMTHLGWRFRAGEDLFFGLILSKLKI